MTHVNEVGLIGLAIVFIAAGLTAQTNEPLTPEELGIEPPPLPAGVVVSTNDTGGITFTAPEKDKMWQLTFIWYPDTGFTNGTTYPIVVHVPFDHDQGFVRVEARQVEMN